MMVQLSFYDDKGEKCGDSVIIKRDYNKLPLAQLNILVPEGSISFDIDVFKD